VGECPVPIFKSDFAGHRAGCALPRGVCSARVLQTLLGAPGLACLERLNTSGRKDTPVRVLRHTSKHGLVQ